MTSFARLLPGVAACSEALLPAGSSRTVESAAGRAHAAIAVARLSGPPERAAGHAGIAVSITHDGGLVAAAAITRTAREAGIGIDVHRLRPPDEQVTGFVATRPEVARAAAVCGAAAGQVLFSIKEAVFKAVHPATGRWLEFDDVVVLLSGRTAARVRLSGGGTVAARWRLDGDVVRSAVLLRGGSRIRHA